MRQFRLGILAACAALLGDGQTVPSSPVGEWQSGPQTLTFRPDGTATAEFHLQQKRSQQITAQHGTYTAEGSRLRIDWHDSPKIRARRDNCTFVRDASSLQLQCDGMSQPVTFGPPAEEPSRLSGLLFEIMISAAFVTLTLGSGLLYLFRRRVLRLMDTQPATARPVEHDEEIWNAGQTTTSSQVANARAARLAGVYAIAGACAIVSLSIGTALTYGGRLTPGLVIAMMLEFAWPVLLVLKEVRGDSWHSFRSWVVIYFVLLLAAGMVLHMLDSSFLTWQIIALWFVMNAIPTVLMLLFSIRALRGVGPVLYIVAWIAMAGLWGLVFAATAQISVAQIIGRIINALHLPLVLWLPFILLSGLLIALPLAWLLLRLIVMAWQRRLISDLSLAMDSVFLLFCVWQATVGLAGNGVPVSLIWFVIAIPVWLAVRITLMLSLRTRSTAKDGPSLLILRVFRIQQQPNKLFDRLSHRWRFVGPVRLIAGADLASRIIQPSSFWKFVSGNLAGEFIGSEADLHRKLEGSANQPDLDGRLRVEEFFCYANMWLRTATLIAARSDVVVVDLRSFTSERKGVRQELNMLLSLVPANRIAFIVDSRTRSDDLAAAEQEAWQTAGPASPNYDAAGRGLHRIDLGRGTDSDVEAACDYVLRLACSV